MNEATESVSHAHREIKLNEKDIERFWKKVDKSGGPDACWLWTATKYRQGYGGFRIKRDVFLAHRVAWSITHGQIPHNTSYHGVCVCHDCPNGDNPTCCNPSHMFLGSQRKNLEDKIQKGRANNVTGEGHGRSKLIDVQVIEIRSLYASGGTSYAKLAEQFGVSSHLVSLIVHHKIWKHVHGDSKISP